MTLEHFRTVIFYKVDRSQLFKNTHHNKLKPLIPVLGNAYINPTLFLLGGARNSSDLPLSVKYGSP